MQRSTLSVLAISLLGCAESPRPPLAGTPTSPVSSARANPIPGRLPPPVIQKIVRARFDRYRACYEAGLARDPTLTGRVSIRFVIGRDGNVSEVRSAGSSLRDEAVIACVEQSFAGLMFPQPEGGIVTVVYPIMFSPADEPAATPAPPGFFAGCSVRDYAEHNALFLDCTSAKLKVAIIQKASDETSASSYLAQFEKWLHREGAGQRKRIGLDGKACWGTVVEGGKDWSIAVVVPIGPKETRLLYCGPKDGQVSSPWCDRALSIMARSEAPKDLLATP